MEQLKEQYPKATEWIESLQPFIVIRGERQVIVKFADGRPSLELTWDKISDIERDSITGQAFNGKNG